MCCVIQTVSIIFYNVRQSMPGKCLKERLRAKSLKTALVNKYLIPTLFRRQVFKGLTTSGSISVFRIQYVQRFNNFFSVAVAWSKAPYCTFDFKTYIIRKYTPSSVGPLPPMPSPSLQKLEKVPSLEITEPQIKESLTLTFYEESEVIHRFNGFQPPTSSLYKWIHFNWTKNDKIYLFPNLTTGSVQVTFSQQIETLKKG